MRASSQHGVQRAARGGGLALAPTQASGGATTAATSGKAAQAKRFARSVARHVVHAERSVSSRLPLAKRTVLFESYGGNGLSCAPEALFREMAADPAFKGWRFIWSVDDPAKQQAAIEHLRGFHEFDVVKRMSPAYWHAVNTAPYLVNNMSFPVGFVKREGQVYINTWHGHPLKRMGHDVRGRIEDGRNVMRNFLAADVLLSSSRAMTERLYLDAFRLRNVFTGTILEEGNPRTDLQFNREAALSELGSLAPHLALEPGEKVLLFAPTWRGADYAAPQDQAESLVDAVELIQATVAPLGFRVMVKPHQVVAHELAENPDLERYLVPAHVAPNVALGVADVLVSDYSSIVYDFLATGRPVVHFVPDHEDYSTYRDVYDPVHRWPGEVARDAEELVNALGHVSAPGYVVPQRYFDAAARLASREDGGVARRVLDAVFKASLDPRRALVAPSDGRTKVLLYAGAMQPNGITASAEALLRHLDHTRYDVTVLLPFTAGNEKRRRRWNGLDRRVRLVFRYGPFAGGIGSAIVRRASTGFGRGSRMVNASMIKRAWSREWRRIFGEARFDYVIDFSGYAPFWGRLLQAGGARRSAIWMHNDMARDAGRTVKGKKFLRRGLEAVFRNYKDFDAIVSVSEDLDQINSTELAAFAPRGRFTWVSNTVDAGQIAMRAAEGRAPWTGSKPHFVMVGRLSPEKNHHRALEAFAALVKQRPDARLDVLGDGPLRGELMALRKELGLSRHVAFHGHVENPHPALAAARALVVSSDYEGQPMVILEAMALGTPVISVEFGSAESAFPQGGGTIVAPCVEALTEAMLNAIDADAPGAMFDGRSYNEEAMRRFEAIFPARSLQGPPARLDESAVSRHAGGAVPTRRAEASKAW